MTRAARIAELILWWAVMLAGALTLASWFVAVPWPARAQSGERLDGHAQHHADFHKEFYRNWKQPGSDKSCCNARITYHGHEIGDCEPTQAVVRNGDWYAWNRLRGEWLRIPDGRIVRERNPSTFDAHLCWTEESGVICFVPPDTGG